VARLVVALAVALTAALGLAVSGHPADASSDLTIRVAYPEEPVTWHASLSGLPATIDLAALWGLPLYRIDHHGQLRPALAASAEVIPGDPEEPWTVEVELRPGRWSDGEPVVAGDVVATIEAIRDADGDASLGPIVSATAVDDRTVRLSFTAPYARWPYLFAGGWSVLPAHVLEADGLEAYRDGVPVSAGPFVIESYDDALRAVFVAHGDSPLGAPLVDRIEVYFTPSYETALGLLLERRVEIAAGYLASSAEERARRIDHVIAHAPLGGTWTSLRWREDSPIAGSEENLRRSRDVLGVGEFVDGLLGRYGDPATSMIPAADGPWSPDRLPAAGIQGAVHLLLPGPHEIKAVTGRVLQRVLRSAGASVTIIRTEHDEEYRDRVDAEFVVHRDGPRPALAGRAPSGLGADDRLALVEADRSARIDDRAFEAGLRILHEQGLERPLYRIAVAHAWHEDLLGVRPSAWPGIAFWDAHGWGFPDDRPPPQEPTVGEDR
jgi:hypothetical protein